MPSPGPALDAPKIRALELSFGKPAVPKEIERIAREVGPETAQWAFTQWELRERARRKFTRASEMLFDRDSLEMATAETLAQGLHARGFPAERTADLTVGAGSDLIALSDGRPALGFETDAERAAMALHNLSVYGRNPEVRAIDCLEADWDFSYAFADPARRASGKRTLRPEEFSPRLDRLVDRLAELKSARLKLSPLLPDALFESIGQGRWFVSHEGECKECLLQLGAPLTPHARGAWAVHFETDSWLEADSNLCRQRDTPASFVFEADPALIRAHGLGNLGLDGLGDSNGYLTSDRFEDRPWLKAAFAVRWSGAWRPAAVKAALRTLSSRVVAVKQRGAGLDVRSVARTVDSDGQHGLELLIYRSGPKLTAVLAERVTSS